MEVDMQIPYERMVWLQEEEWNELRFLKYKLQKKDIFVDVGSNIGIWTMVAASTIGNDGLVYSFEPNPNTFKKLCANIQRNCLQDSIKPINKAIAQENSVVNFSCQTEHNLSAISDQSVHSDTNLIEIEAINLDSVLNNKAIAGIKLDTEGFELECLLGAANTIKESFPWLIVEFNTTLLKSAVLGDWEVFKYLKSLGYKPYKYDGPNSEFRIDKSFQINGYCNILFQNQKN